MVIVKEEDKPIRNRANKFYGVCDGICPDNLDCNICEKYEKWYRDYIRENPQNR